jgi:4a-hydroxytetrahydrobiopterin dehydratase
MITSTTESLAQKRCTPCDGMVSRLIPDEAEQYLEQTPEWDLADNAQRIRREWRVKNFAAAVEFLNNVAELAEKEDHHPDLHLVGYRDVCIEIYTHAIGGLSENDFILAAKIDQIPVSLKTGR